MASVVLFHEHNVADVASIGSPVDVDVTPFEKLRITVYSGGTLATPDLDVTWTDYGGSLSKQVTYVVPTTELFTFDLTVKGQAANFTLINSRELTVVGMMP